MILTFCLDSKNGITFNGKRLTQDVVHRERLIALAIEKNHRLIMNSYSGKLFGYNTGIDDDTELLKLSDSNTICFIENVKNISQFIKKADTIVLYRWDRAYPFDYKFDFSLLDDFELKHSEKFKGKLHSEIIEEIYERK